MARNRCGLVATIALAATVVRDAGARGDGAANPHETTHEMTHEMMVWEPELFLLSEVLELVPLADERPVRYDLIMWFGDDVNRVWLKADGAQATSNGSGETELQILYGQLVSPFWDAQIGLRVDLGYGAGDAEARALAALGLQGLAPGWFEVEPTLFISQSGDVSASLTASYDLYVTQRLVSQLRVETAVAWQSVPTFGIGSGLNDLDVGLRVRYEVARELAPYLGVSWQRLFMETGELARAAGQDIGEVSVVAGLRLWY